jgi:hypothetical protein
VGVGVDRTVTATDGGVGPGLVCPPACRTYEALGSLAVKTLEELATCKCGLPATANGRECPKHYRERLASVSLDGSVTATRTKANYFDKTSLDATFGEDRVEKYWDETNGHGALVPGDDGELYHKNHKGQVAVATDDVIADITAGEESADA